MSETILVALISLVGTLGGTFGGIVMSSKLTNYRIERLEEQVKKHNSIVERTYILEGKITEVEHDIRDMKSSKGA